MNLSITDKKCELNIQRQKLTLRVYLLFLILGAVGGTLSIATNPVYHDVLFEKIALLLSVLFFCFGLLFLSHRYLKTFEAKDHVFFFVTLIIYGLVVTIPDQNPIITTSIWFVSIASVLMTSLSYKKLITFCLVHIAFSVYFYFEFNSSLIQITPGNYISIISNAIIFLFGSTTLIKLVVNYENNLTHEYVELNRKNLELQALNEEYYAAQEELFQQYDQISALHNESIETNEKLNAILSVTEDLILDYNVTHQKFEFIKNQGLLFADLELSINPKEAFKDLLASDDRIKFDLLWHNIESGSIDYIVTDFRLVPPRDEIEFVQLIILRYFSEIDHSKHFLLAIKNVTEQEQLTLKIYDMAYYDNLTHLHNRASLIEKIDTQIHELYHQFYVVIADISDFQSFNNVFGYDVGDLLLKEIAQMFKGLDSSFKYCSRIGGDTFAFIVPLYFGANQLATKLENLHGKLHHNENLIQTSFNFGISEYPTSGTSGVDLLKNAEIALSKIKQNPSLNHQFYDVLLSAQTHRKVMMTQSLEQAIENQNITMVYQPKVSTLTQKIIGFEALARWHSEELGHVSPAEFVILAEKTGLIHPLGQQIIEQSCAFTGQIQKIDRNLTVSINISGAQLITEHFASDFYNTISRFGLEAHQIGIEITETSVMQNLERAISHLVELKQKGFKIYLDDFGTGYSSMNYLYNLPIDYLKIDKSFIDQMESDKRKYTMVKNVIKLASDLGIKCIAEGVEIQSQFNLLKTLKCDIIQGYYFSKPITDRQALDLLMPTLAPFDTK